MSTRHSIIILPNPRLRQRSKRVGLLDDDIKKIIADMTASTLDWEDNREHEFGVALAAVQIDELYRIIVVRHDFEDKDNREFDVFINPEIVKFLGEPTTDYEGCLSVKDIYGKVPRYPKVKVKAQDLTGRVIRLTVEGFLARVFQHEIDHTNGILFIDHIKDQDAFFEIQDNGKLKKLDYEQISQDPSLW